MTPAQRVYREAPRLIMVVGDRLTVVAALDADDSVRLATTSHAVAEAVNVLRLVQNERAAAARRGTYTPLDYDRLARRLKVATEYAKNSIAVLVVPEKATRRKKRKRAA